MKLLPLFLIPLLVVEAYGDDVNLAWMRDGMSAKIGYYRPVKVELSTTKPERVTKPRKTYRIPCLARFPWDRRNLLFRQLS